MTKLGGDAAVIPTALPFPLLTPDDLMRAAGEVGLLAPPFARAKKAAAWLNVYLPMALRFGQAVKASPDRGERIAKTAEIKNAARRLLDALGVPQDGALPSGLSARTGRILMPGMSVHDERRMQRPLCTLNYLNALPAMLDTLVQVADLTETAMESLPTPRGGRPPEMGQQAVLQLMVVAYHTTFGRTPACRSSNCERDTPSIRWIGEVLRSASKALAATAPDDAAALQKIHNLSVATISDGIRRLCVETKRK